MTFRLAALVLAGCVATDGAPDVPDVVDTDAADSDGPVRALDLGADPLVVGADVAVTVRGAAPGDTLVVLVAAGLGDGPCLDGGACLDLTDDAVEAARGVADADGTARLTLRLPTAVSPGDAVALQAASTTSPDRSEALVDTALTRVVGLDARPDAGACTAPARPPTPGPLTLTRVYRDVPLSLPVQLVRRPGDAAWWYAIEVDGRVVRFADTPDADAVEVVADLRAEVVSGGELGLLSIAFHPTRTDEIYVYFTGGTRAAIRSRIVRLTSDDDGRTFGDPVEILEVAQPFANHNGGTLNFGPDGHLWFAFGDGGAANDPGNRAQDLDTLLGKVIRLDVDGATPYAIPSDNPWAGGGGRPEIWALGLRNPYRWSFDRLTGQAWIADVGQDRFEEVSLLSRGANLGWRMLDGTACVNPTPGAPACDDPALTDPVWVLPHPAGSVSVIGGFVYRGSAAPDLQGTYVLAEFYSGRILGLAPGPDGALADTVLAARAGMQTSSLAEDADGELYVLTYAGEVFRLDPAGPAAPDRFPRRLSETGCFDDPTTPSPALVPYAPRVTLWADGLDKARWLVLPDDASATVGADGDLDLPVGTMLFKQLRDGDRIVETRLYVRHDDDGWGAYTYVTLPDGSDAVLAPAGDRVTLDDGRVWDVPAPGDCATCHTPAAGVTLGLELAQLDQAQAYGDAWARQLDTLAAIGVLPAARPAVTPLARLDDPGPVAPRARAYLHANCAMCHRPGGGGLSDMDLRIATPLAGTRTCDVPGTDTSAIVEGARRLTPGLPQASLLWLRLASDDPRLRMPQLGTRLPHADAVDVVGAWIDDLRACP